MRPVSNKTVLFAVRQVYQDSGRIPPCCEPGGFHSDQPVTLHISKYCESDSTKLCSRLSVHSRDRDLVTTRDEGVK
jgi:hypothetical protein